MGRSHSYMDEAFRKDSFDPYDKGTFTSNLVFVIMPFCNEMNDVYKVISEECKIIGLNSKRADDSIGSGIVLREIVESIEEAELLICDLTHERPNVYYELGYAHGVGNESSEILLIAKKGTTLHFDIAPLRVRYYQSNDHLRQIIKENIPEMLRKSRS